MAEPERQKSDRVAIACLPCRLRKIRCTGGYPCRFCSRSSAQCHYPPKQCRKRTKTRRDLDHANKPQAALQDQDSVPKDPQVIHDPRHLSPAAQESSTRSTETVHAVAVTTGIPVAQNSQNVQNPISSASARTARTNGLLSPPLQQNHSLSPKGNVVERPAIPSPAELSISEGSTTAGTRSHVYKEVNGVKEEGCACLSPCFSAGVAWVCEKTATRAFAKTAERFMDRGAEQHFSTCPWLTPRTTRTEPSEATAWEYVNAFFEDCWEARLGFIHRPDFEAQLQAHYHDQSSSRNDCAAFALRNVVFAAGYRSLLAKKPEISFMTAQQKAWQGYFQKSLSVLTDLLLSSSRLMVVQALALMTCYVEGLGSPGIQRVLCHNAVHAAITQGLHLEGNEWTHSSMYDSLDRAWLWWSLYALEKHLSFTSGRPSMIDDSIITVPLPLEVPPGSTVDLVAATFATRHAKISSRILREIVSKRARGMSTNELQEAVMDIDQQLKSLLDDLPPELRIGVTTKASEATIPFPRRIHALFLHLSIHGSLLAIHSHFSYPWLSDRLRENSADAGLDAQVIVSSTTVAESARKILLAIRTVTSNVNSPTWLVFTYPIYAHLGLFVHVLSYPTLPTASADLGILDICAGHFGYIDFMTSSEISVSLPRESVNLAAKVVKASRKGQQKDQVMLNKGSQREQDADLQSRTVAHPRPKGTHSSSGFTLSDQGEFSNAESAGWNLLPTFDTVGANDYMYDGFDV